VQEIDNLMNYPTMYEVEAADHRQLCEWHRFLGTPGRSAAGRSYREFVSVIEAESKIANKINERFLAGGGMTEDISESLGWTR
jgi:hypothetical protein